jgi:hypothetical protein
MDKIKTYRVSMIVAINTKPAPAGVQGFNASIRLADGQPLAPPFWGWTENDARKQAVDWLERRTVGFWTEVDPDTLKEI